MKYKTVNNLAENIFDFEKNNYYIHHIKENINYYLEDLLKECKKENIVGVITTENIDHDMNKIFGVKVDMRAHHNQEKLEKNISNVGYQNLKKYLQKDYECIDKLFSMGRLSKEQYDILST